MKKGAATNLGTDSHVKTLLEAFQGREFLPLEDLPESVPAIILLTLMRRKVIVAMGVNIGEERKLAWRLLH